MKQKYIKPDAVILEMDPVHVICGSSDNRCSDVCIFYSHCYERSEGKICTSLKYKCSGACSIWHICQDRSFGRHCLDKK